jgi:hypothetical protein
MPEIRAMTTADLRPVIRLLETRHPGWKGDERFLRDTVLEHPWADPDLPSLVAVADDGSIVGFIGSQVRRLRFGDRSLRGVVCSHLVVDSGPAAGAAGALLVGRLLRGPQDLTWSDSANDPVVRIWRTFGGRLDHARACDWMLVLRPASWMTSAVRRLARRRPIGRAQIPVAALPAHVIVARGRRGDAAGSPAWSEDAGPGELIAALGDGTARWRSVSVAHDEEHLDHVFSLIRRAQGRLICRIVRRQDNAIGWYAYVQGDGSAARVLHLAAHDRDVDVVFEDLVLDARRSGCFALAGRLEPHLGEALSRRLAVLELARRPVIHARDPGLAAVLASEDSLLTQLDSEWFVP